LTKEEVQTLPAKLVDKALKEWNGIKTKLKSPAALMIVEVTLLALFN